jgi:tetratricopeptide (TPR) repeat protein
MKHKIGSIALLLITLTAGLFAQTAAGSKKRQAWELGSYLSMAALLHAESDDAALVNRQFAKAATAASALGIKLPSLPEKTGKKVDDSAAVLHYLLNSTGNPIGQILRDELGPECAATFEIALKSNILLMLYGPGESQANTIAGVIRNRRAAAGLPDTLTEPLLKLIEDEASFEQVKKELLDLHEYAPLFIELTEHSSEGERLYAAKDYAGSASEFTKAIALDPEGAEYYFSRGRAFLQLGKHNEAIADYTKVIQLKDPTAAANLPLVYHNRGLCYGLLGRNALAIADLTMAIKLRPDYASAYKVRGIVYRKMGNLKSANADLQAAEELQPGITQ